MPKINVQPWDFDLDEPKVRKPRQGSSHARLIAYMAEQPAGSVSLSVIQRQLRVSASGLKKLRETLNNKDHETTKALTALGVRYIAGVGRGSKSYLVKAAEPHD
jgi:hypothetical protein